MKLFSDRPGQAHFLVDCSARLSILTSSHSKNYLCYCSKDLAVISVCNSYSANAELLSYFVPGQILKSSYFDNERSEIIPHAILDQRIRYKEFLRLQLTQNPNLIVYRLCSAVNYD